MEIPSAPEEEPEDLEEEEDLEQQSYESVREHNKKVLAKWHA